MLDELVDILGRFEDPVISQELLDVVSCHCRSHWTHDAFKGIVRLEGKVIAQDLTMLFSLI